MTDTEKLKKRKNKGILSKYDGDLESFICML